MSCCLWTFESFLDAKHSENAIFQGRYENEDQIDFLPNKLDIEEFKLFQEQMAVCLQQKKEIQKMQESEL